MYNAARSWENRRHNRMKVQPRRKHKTDAANDAVSEGRVRNETFDLLNARPEGEKQQGADSRQANSFDPLQQLEPSNKSLQERREFLIFFLAHGVRFRVILSLNRELVYPI